MREVLSDRSRGDYEGRSERHTLAHSGHGNPWAGGLCEADAFLRQRFSSAASFLAASKASSLYFVVELFSSYSCLWRRFRSLFLDADCSDLALELVFKAHSRGSSVKFAFAQFAVEQGFGHSCVLHAR